MEEYNQLVVEYLVLHHSASDKQVCCEDIRAWHLERGWNDIGYHWLINDIGEVVGGRPEDIIGAHALGLNRQSLGICCIGNYQSECPSPRMMEALIDTLANLCLKFKLSANRIIGHSEVIKLNPQATITECPGEALVNLLPVIREAVQAKLDLVASG